MSEESFVTRWSRLKQQQQNEQDAATEAREPQSTLAEQPRDIHQLTDSDMPPIESLDESSDYSVFLSEKVSESLRQTALRKMFHLPALNVVDGLDDYAEDFTHFEPLGDILTHDMRRLARREGKEVETQDIEEQEVADNAGAEGGTAEVKEASEMQPGTQADHDLREGEADEV